MSKKKFVICFMVASMTLGGFLLAFAEEIHYDSGGRRDPFIPLLGPGGILSQKTTRADIVIEGIIFDPSGGSIVVVDGDVYKAGDNVKGANIIQIMRDRVILASEDEEKTLWLREEILPEETDTHG